METERRLNQAGFSSESIAAQYETDAVLAEWMAEHPDDFGFPPDDHYFHAAFRAELEESRIDRWDGVKHEQRWTP